MYSDLYILDLNDQGVCKKKIKVASDFLQKQNHQDSEPSSALDRTLFEIARNQPESLEAFLCLRCRVSYPIVEKVKILFKKLCDQNEIDLKEMLACVLDDTGESFIRVPKRAEDGSIQMLRMPFNWSALVKLSMNRIRPFGADVIYSFEPNLSSLPTWTKNKVQANQELKDYLKNSGILLISAWALIADSSVTRVKEACRFHYRGKLTLEEIEKLHGSYLLKYKEAKFNYRNSRGKNYGWIPDENFLASLDPPQTNIEELSNIDQALRQYLAGPYAAKAFKENEESQLPSPISEIDEEKDEDLIRVILQALRRSAIPIIENAIVVDRSKWGKGPSRKLAWELYSQGLSQREIALRCEHKQAWVSKLLSEKSLSTSIAQEAAVELIRRSEFLSIRKSPNGVDLMIDQLRNYLLSSEQEGGISMLREIIQIVLAQ